MQATIQISNLHAKIAQNWQIALFNCFCLSGLLQLSIFRFLSLALFPFPPSSRKFQLISVTSSFTRLNMKTKYVCRCLIRRYVIFHNNLTMSSTNLQIKTCRWGGGRKKSPIILSGTKASEQDLELIASKQVLRNKFVEKN